MRYGLLFKAQWCCALPLLYRQVSAHYILFTRQPNNAWRSQPSKEHKMNFRKSMMAAALVATFAAGASAAYLDQDIYNDGRHLLTALIADEGIPHNLVTALKADEGVPHNLNTALKADEGVPQNLVTALKADDGVPHDLVTALKGDEGVPHNIVTA
jgi:hypothetical protein